MAPECIRVMIVDDHPLIRRGLRTCMAGREDVVIVAEAGDGLEALDQCAVARPDVVLLDVQMPRLGGIDTLRRIRGQYPGVKVIMLTSFQDQDTASAALQEGAGSYLLKDVAEEDLIATVRLVHAGHVLLPPGVSAPAVAKPGSQAPLLSLSYREREILALLAVGLGNKEIARQTALSLSTVKFHISNILEKLDVTSRTEAAAIAVARGWVPSRPGV